MTGDAFLDTVGAGASPGGPRPATAPAAPDLTEALAPIAAMLAALLLVAATGLSRRVALPEAVEPYAYGFFLDRYPLFAFALVYGAARIIAVASSGGAATVSRRLIIACAGLVLLAGAGLYPTFGGLMLRGGYATGSMAFLTGQPLWLAYALGAGITAAMFGAIVGGAGIAANRPLRPTLRRARWAGLSFLCLWFGAIVLGLAHAFGVGPWPARAMTLAEATLAAGLLLLAASPHGIVTALRGRRSVA